MTPLEAVPCIVIRSSLLLGGLEKGVAVGDGELWTDGEEVDAQAAKTNGQRKIANS